MPGTVYIIANATRAVQQCRACFAFLRFAAQRCAEFVKYISTLHLTSLAPFAFAVVAVQVCLLGGSPAWAVPSNFTIVNTVNASYQVNGNAFNYSSSVSIVTDDNAANSAPTGIVIDDLEVEENASGIVIAGVLVDDPDPADVHTFVVSDNRFEVVGGDLKLIDGVFLDFESEPTVNLLVTAIDPDGASVSRNFVVTVLNVNETPFDIVLTNSNLEANNSGALIGELSSLDPDVGDTFTYSLVDPRFEIIDSELRLRDGVSLPPGTTVDLEVVVADAGGLTYNEIFVVQTLQSSAHSEIEFSLLANGFGGGIGNPESLPVAISQCSLSSDPNGLYTENPNPNTSRGLAVTVPGTQNLLPTELYKSGETAFFRLIDPDANLDPLAIDFVLAALSSSTGDLELIRFFETNIDTGIFTGYVQTAVTAAVANDCILSVGEDATISIEYTDALDSSDVSSAKALIDPISRVFASGTGRLINGVRITVVDALTGQPAQVSGDEGRSVFPNSILSGGFGAAYHFSEGTYRFPYLLAGQYKLLVEPPNRFSFPSEVVDPDLQSLPGAPFHLSAASRGDTLVMNPNSVFQVDIPLDLLEIMPSSSRLELFKNSPGTPGSGGLVPLGGSQCRLGDVFQAQPNPVTPAGTIVLPAELSLTSAETIQLGDAVFVQVEDRDQDADPFAPDQLTVRVQVSNGSDMEELVLIETGDSTGIFTGYIQTSPQFGENFDCELNATAGDIFEVEYVDALDNSDISSVQARIQRTFFVFDSSTGEPLNGAQVTMVDVATGQPARILSEDGVSEYPSTVASGGEAVDSSGNRYDFMPGEFRFPLVEAGTYRLSITAPVSYVFPSLVPDDVIQQLANADFRLTPGSRGEEFIVVTSGRPDTFDVPLDPIAAEIFVSKIASKQSVAVGDFVQYQISVENPHISGTVSDLILVDVLPVGFRLVENSAYFNMSDSVEPDVAPDGRTLTFPVSDLGPQSSFKLKYVVQVTAGANTGTAVNSAYLSGRGVGASNTATASVTVGEDLLQSKATILGRVTTGGCSSDASGFASARIFLEDGSYVLTDSEGRFHFEGVAPGTHVVQLDVGSLPESQQIIPCGVGNAFAGTGFSQFVDLQAGSLWRADFYLGERASLLENVHTTLVSEYVEGAAGKRTLKVSYELVSEGILLNDLKSIIMLPDELVYVAGSAELNGQHIEDPQGSEFNALTFRMMDSTGPETRVLSFQITAPQPAHNVQVRAVTLFQADSKPVRTPVLKNTVNLSDEEDREWQYTAVSAVDKKPRSSEHLMQDVGVIEITRDRKVRIGLRLEIPELTEDRAPEFDTAWLALQDATTEIIWPVAGLNPRIPTTDVYVKHSVGERVRVLLGGVEVNPLSFEGITIVPGTTKSISRWRNVPLESGNNKIEVLVTDSKGALTVLDKLVHFSSSPIRAELVPEASQLDSDGLTPAVIAVRFYDRDGYPVRPGLTGSFSIKEPFEVLNQAALQAQIDPNIGNQDSERYLIRRDGIAYIQLEPTTETGAVHLRFEFGDNRFEEVRARLVAAQRDWVLVGFGEGSLAYKKLSGNMLALDDAGIDNKLGSSGRVAFYAKGKISGRWLMTVAYDSDKQIENSLGQQIDPNKYYTLYGDGTYQRYDAQSRRKLYVKIENEDFRILFGDYDTSFDDSELSRYNRRFNGFKNEFSGKKWQASVFAAKTDMAHVRDELRGDGTSGVYHLSRTSLVANSESIVIETRDRFRSEIILNQKALSRYTDYTIDYSSGSIIFKRPVFSQDNNFNPNVIIVEYEVVGLGKGDEWVAGGRVTRSFDDNRARLSGTYIQDDTQGVSGKLAGADLEWQVNTDNKIIVEVAHSDTQLSGEGSAYILQLEHQSQKMAGRVYLRQQDKKFGMGQQNAVEAGTRKVGIEGEYRASEGIQIRALMYKQSSLDNVSERTVAEMRADYRLGKSSVNAGLRSVEEQLSSGKKGTARQLTLGTSRSLMHEKLQLNSNAEFDIGGGDSTDFPTRLLLEADYELMAGVNLLAKQELSWAKNRNTSDSRIGIEAQPWTGANITSFVQRSGTGLGGENDNRLLSTIGVLQQLRVNDNWLFDVGFDRVHTLDKSSDDTTDVVQSFADTAIQATAVTPVLGSFNNDFVAAFVGVGYREDDWDVSSRLEFHKGDVADKWNVLIGASHQLSEGKVLSGSVSVLREDRGANAKTLQSDVRFGLAWRPDSSDWIFLNRLDWIYSNQEDGVFDIRSNKLVDNFNANLRINESAQLSVQLGLKYVLDQIDGEDFRAFTALAGSELRYDIAPKWDVGMRASYLYSGAAKNARYSYGISIGHSPVKNLWLSVGYNLQGFQDEDFFAADYTARGPFLSFRFKMDQESMRSFLSYAGLRSGAYGRSARSSPKP